LGILAHVDAGKTTLTERLLFLAGVIDHVGSVDAGDTQTDTLALERQRGITIKSAVVSFELHGVTVNLIDTPGHPDFIAEVERVLNVLDGAVLVLSAVEGVQSQTRVLMRTLQRLRIPTLLFVNKIDRGGADLERVLREMATKLTAAVVPMGRVTCAGTRQAAFEPSAGGDDGYRRNLESALANHSDGILRAVVEGEAAVPYRRLRRELAKQSKCGLVHPVFSGSAITGAGVEPLMAGIAELLPAVEGDARAPLSATVFKVERGPAGEKVAYVRLFSGVIAIRDRLHLQDGTEQKVTGISVFEHGATLERRYVAAGRIAKVQGLGDVRIGDVLGRTPRLVAEHHFAPPTLETAVVPSREPEIGALFAALTQLAEQDPLINLRQDDVRRELYLSLYGEVQKEVIQATLAADYGLAVDFRESSTICIERPAGRGESFDLIKGPGNPFLAAVGLRVEPGPVDSGIRYERATEILGTMPHAFYKAVEDTVHETLRQGLHGWQVTDCLVTLTHTGYYPRQSHAHQKFSKSMSSTGADFRGLTPLVLMAALRQAGTHVFEPLHRFQLEAPDDTLGVVAATLARLQAVTLTQDQRGAVSILEGEIPAARVRELQLQLPALTRGEGVLECAFERYERVRGEPPERPRTDANPLDRKEYLLHVLRRV
jgi:ribosomal protection tetracycline resistance protein